MLGYFFGPRRRNLPALDQSENLLPSDAHLVRKFGDLGIINGKWLLIGRSIAWDRARWPMPSFARFEELTGRTYEVSYDPDDPNRVVAERLTTPDAAADMPKDGLLGAGATEVLLTRLLGGHS